MERQPYASFFLQPSGVWHRRLYLCLLNMSSGFTPRKSALKLSNARILW